MAQVGHPPIIVTGVGGGIVPPPPPPVSGANTYSSAFASPPADPSEGDLWFPTNTLSAYRYSGAAWVPWGPIWPVTSPSTAGFAWVNQGTAVETAQNGYIHLLGTTGTNVRMRVKAVPARPYTVTVGMLVGAPAQNYAKVGLVWRESATGRLHLHQLQYNGGWNVASSKWTNETTLSANYVAVGAQYQVAVLWLRITEDATNRICHYSFDGYNWFLLHTIARADFLTADQIGYFTDGTSATVAPSMTIFHWAES